MQISPISLKPNPQDTVVGFHPSSRSWVLAGQPGSSYEKLPALDGALLVSPQALHEAADDFGHVVSRRPSAVLRPGSVDDIARMVRFARQHGLKIGPRGQAHTMYGHSQVEAGLSIDMRSLATIHSIGEDRAEVDAGVLWVDLVDRAIPLGRTPPVLTDFLELTVGGTLSVGGVSGNSFRYGAQVDNVLELQVVTGEGETVTCSSSQDKELFEAVLAGLGQCGVIVRATLRLIPAPAQARVFDLGYADTATQLRDQQMLIEEGRFDFLLGVTLPTPGGGWATRMQALSYQPQPDNERLLAGLSFQRGSEQIADMPYIDWAKRLVPPMAELRKRGHFTRPHPWCDLFVPASRLEGLLTQVLQEVSPAEITPEFPILTYGFKAERITRPLFRPPGEGTFFLLDVLRTASPETRDATQMVAHNRALYERNRSWGGTHYTISAIALSPADWKQHYGPAWEAFAAARRRHDPDSVLTPGPNIFG